MYAAELKGIVMAMNIIKQNLLNQTTTARPLKATIFSDNQAAIKALHQPRIVSDQELLKTALTSIHELEQQEVRITVR